MSPWKPSGGGSNEEATLSSKRFGFVQTEGKSGGHYRGKVMVKVVPWPT
jgi:hypothetical protein